MIDKVHTNFVMDNRVDARYRLLKYLEHKPYIQIFLGIIIVFYYSRFMIEEDLPCLVTMIIFLKSVF